MARQHDLLRIAADGGAVLLQDVALASELLGCATEEVPVLGEPRRRPQRAALAVAADADRRGGVLRRARLAPCGPHPGVAAPARATLPRGQGGDDLPAPPHPLAAGFWRSPP